MLPNSKGAGILGSGAFPVEFGAGLLNVLHDSLSVGNS